jgi:hypothetical protein
LEKSCREEWEKLQKYRRTKLVASYPRLKAVIAAKGASTKYWVKGSENLCKCKHLFNTFAKMSKNLFLPCHYGVVCRLLRDYSKKKKW